MESRSPASLLNPRKQRRAGARERNDLQVGTMRRTNLLVVGSAAATGIVLDMLRLELGGPVSAWRSGQPLVLPASGRAATLILDEPTALSAGDQHRLVRWLDDVAGDVRVISTSRIPLWPRVQSGQFDETLYYRLNTMCLEVGA